MQEMMKGQNGKPLTCDFQMEIWPDGRVSLHYECSEVECMIGCPPGKCDCEQGNEVAFFDFHDEVEMTEEQQIAMHSELMEVALKYIGEKKSSET